ncbi:MAG: AGE family epimerase/isomerase [Bacteroidales bacterium]|nr:AGE family epimerase/isomerase [Bacteroidales bacterium]
MSIKEKRDEHLSIEIDYCKVLIQYRSELLNSVVPFWMKYAIDWKNGGICTCLSDKGDVLSQDKYMWSQLRAIWTFSALYNKIEKKKEWLDVALHIFEFVRKYGRDDKGQWVYSVNKNGTPLRGATSIYADGFAINGFTELAKATGNKDVIQLALDTYYNVQKRLAVPGSYPTEPLPIPHDCIAHGISMIFSMVFNELGQYLNNADILQASIDQAEQVMTVFLRPEQQRLYEYVRTDNTLLETQPGLTTVPGHALESMCFMIHIYQQRNDQKRIQQAIDCIRWHTELGWDYEYGGILLAINAEGSFWEDKWDTKLWWTHAEALYALLLVYSISQEEWCLNWFRQVHDYTFSHYPVSNYGEWFQRLDRYGNHISNIADLPVKDPFHVARSLINCIGVLEKLVSTGKEENVKNNML